MALFTRKTILWAKVEATSGTPETPAATNTMVIRNATLTPLEVDAVDRALMRGYMGASPQIVVGQRVLLDFEIELAGAGGAANAAPKYKDLLLGCGMTGAANSTTSYDFTCVNSGFQSLTLETYIDGVKHPMYGAMGDVTWDFTVKQIPVMKFKFTGRYTTPSDTAATYNDTGWTTPLGVNKDNTPTFQLHAITQANAFIQTLNLTLGNQVAFETLVGTEFIQIVDRKGAGNVTMLAQTIAGMGAMNWFTEALNMTLGNLDIIHGTATGNKVELIAPSVQILKPTYGDLDGMRTIQAGLQLIPTSSTVGELTFRTF